MTTVEKYINTQLLASIQPALDLFKRYEKIYDLSIEEIKLRLAIDGYDDDEFMILTDYALKLKYALCEISEIVVSMQFDKKAGFDEEQFDMSKFADNVSHAFVWFNYMLSKFVANNILFKPLYEFYMMRKQEIENMFTKKNNPVINYACAEFDELMSNVMKMDFKKWDELTLY